MVVQLGEGLDTQRQRLPLPAATRYSIDLPEALALRERFMPADERHRHLAFSATDPRWLCDRRSTGRCSLALPGC